MSSSSGDSSRDPRTLKDNSFSTQNDIQLQVLNSQNRSLDLEAVSAIEVADTGPPTDGGRDAWLFLAGCFVFEALVWGFPFSFGVFQSYYTTHVPSLSEQSGIAAIGTCSSGVMYLFAPVSLSALEAWPSIRRLSSILGLIVSVTALVASSFSTRVWHLILTQGILYAIGGSLLYSPTMFYLDEWFIKRKGLAFGIMWAGVGTSGAIFPFLLSHLLNTYGFRTTLRIWSITLLVLCTPLIYFVKPRLAPSSVSPRKLVSHAFFFKSTHLSLQACNVLESLGFFLPSIYLPSYVASLSLPHESVTSSLLLALLNTFSVFGAIVLGHLCDRFHVRYVILISSIGATLSVLVFWGLASELRMLILFTCTYGFFAGGFSSIWSGMMKEVKKSEEDMGREAGIGTLMGLFAAGRGLGAVMSGPVSEVLLRENLGAGYQGRYGAVIAFTGVSAFCGLVCFLVPKWKQKEMVAQNEGGEEGEESVVE